MGKAGDLRVGICLKEGDVAEHVCEADAGRPGISGLLMFGAMGHVPGSQSTCGNKGDGQCLRCIDLQNDGCLIRPKKRSGMGQGEAEADLRELCPLARSEFWPECASPKGRAGHTGPGASSEQAASPATAAA